LAAGQYFRENPFPGHDAVSDRIKDIAPVMADLADLGDLQQNFIADFQSGADGKQRKINAFCCEIFREISIFYVQSLRPDLVNAFPRQKAHLPDARLCMGIVYQTKIF